VEEKTKGQREVNTHLSFYRLFRNFGLNSF